MFWHFAEVHCSIVGVSQETDGESKTEVVRMHKNKDNFVFSNLPTDHTYINLNHTL